MAGELRAGIEPAFARWASARRPSLAARAKVGGPDQNRTDDLLIANETLSQLSYGPIRRSNGREYEEAASPCQGKADRPREACRRQKPRSFNLLGGVPAGLRRLAPSLASRPWRG